MTVDQSPWLICRGWFAVHMWFNTHTKELGWFVVDNADSVQIAFTALAGGPSLRWTEVMREIIPSALARYSGYFIADGASHCTIPGNSLYTVTADGVRLIDWLAALVEDGTWDRTVDCCGGTRTSRHPPPQRQMSATEPSSSSGGRRWQCAVAFAEHYRRAGFPVPNSTDGSLVERLYRDFEQSNCAFNH